MSRNKAYYITAVIINGQQIVEITRPSGSHTYRESSTWSIGRLAYSVFHTKLRDTRPWVVHPFLAGSIGWTAGRQG